VNRVLVKTKSGAQVILSPDELTLVPRLNEALKG
jgi:hypothetical protein